MTARQVCFNTLCSGEVCQLATQAAAQAEHGGEHADAAWDEVTWGEFTRRTGRYAQAVGCPLARFILLRYMPALHTARLDPSLPTPDVPDPKTYCEFDDL